MMFLCISSKRESSPTRRLGVMWVSPWTQKKPRLSLISLALRLKPTFPPPKNMSRLNFAPEKEDGLIGDEFFL